MNTPPRRVLVALDASTHSRAALESAALLATALDAELFGVFVQDLDLVNLARLPFARETGLTSASVRVLDAQSMELAMAAQARKAQRALEATAHRHGLSWSFRVTRGAVVTELLAAADEAEVLALGIAGQMEITGRRLGSTVRGIVASASCSVLIEQRARPRGPATLLIHEDVANAARTLARAQQLARARNGNLVIALTGSPEARERLSAALADQVHMERSRVHVATLSDGAGGLHDLLERLPCGLIVMSMDSALLSAEPGLIAELDRPVLLEK